MEGFLLIFIFLDFPFFSVTKKSMWPIETILTHKTNHKCQPTNDGVWNNQESMDFKSNGAQTKHEPIANKMKKNDREYINKVIKKTSNKIMIWWSFLSRW